MAMPDNVFSQVTAAANKMQINMRNRRISAWFLTFSGEFYITINDLITAFCKIDKSMALQPPVAINTISIGFRGFFTGITRPL